MTPPDTPQASQPAVPRGGPAVSSCLRARSLPVLKKRADFLAAAKGRRAPVDGFMLQARKRNADEPGAGIRVGFTCSKKVGNAVTRNRAKRRLRALAHEVLRAQGHEGWDYVLIGKPGVTTERPFDALKSDLLKALDRIHR